MWGKTKPVEIHGVFNYQITYSTSYVATKSEKIDAECNVLTDVLLCEEHPSSVSEIELIYVVPSMQNVKQKPGETGII